MKTPSLAPRCLAFAVALAIGAAACGGAATERDTVDPGPFVTEAVPASSNLPANQFALFDGSQATLASFSGRPLVVNFWASWCPSCVAEMSAAFKPVQQELADQVTFLGMNIQDDRGPALRLLEETGVEWISAEDPAGELYAELGGLGMPFTVFITADGQSADEHNGPLNESQLRDQISETLGV